MDIKYFLGALIVILLISNVYFFNEMQSSNQDNSIAIGDNSLKLPGNYSTNRVDISNSSDTIMIFKVGNVNMDSAIKEYVNTTPEKYSIETKQFDSKLPSKKTIANGDDNSSIIKYWFEADNTIYQIQVSNKNINEYDDVAKDIINSIA